MKKAITPLISTIFLLVFAVGLGALVMSWGSSETRLASSVGSCPNVEIAVTKINLVEQACMKDNSLIVTLENNGDEYVKTIRVVALSQDTSVSDEFDAGISAGEFKRMSYKLNGPTPSKIRLIPIIDKDVCIKKKIELENVRGC